MLFRSKADALYTWFTTHGVDKENIQRTSGLKDKEIKIEVKPREK